MLSQWNSNTNMSANHRKASIIVFSLYFSWLLALPFEGQVLYAIANLHNIDPQGLIFFTIAAHFLGLLSCGFFVKNIKIVKRIMIFSILSCILGSTIFFFSFSIIWYISLICTSFLSGISVGSWGFYFKAYTPSNERIKTAADVLIYSNILMIIINMIAINISPYIGLFVSIAMLMGAFLFALKLPSDYRTVNKDSSTEAPKLLNPTKPLIFLCLFIVIITINSGLMYQVINPSFAHHKGLVSWYWAVPYIIALSVMKNLSPKFNRAYILYVAIAMIGFAFLSFMTLDRSAGSYLIVNTLMLGACGVYDLFWWSILGEMLDYSNNPAKILGIGLSFNVLGVLFGGIVGSITISSDPHNYNSSIIALVVVFTILIMLPLLNKRLSVLLKNHVFLSELSQMSSNERKKIIGSFVENSLLTGRESEIASLLLKGRTYKMIADELYLSENTVKTHIKNIYSKLNIQSKTELVKLMLEREYETTK